MGLHGKTGVSWGGRALTGQLHLDSGPIPEFLHFLNSEGSIPPQSPTVGKDVGMQPRATQASFDR